MNDILEALNKQQKPSQQDRVICNDGLLSVSDAVWGITYWSQFYDVPVNERHEFLERIDKYE